MNNSSNAKEQISKLREKNKELVATNKDLRAELRAVKKELKEVKSLNSTLEKLNRKLNVEATKYKNKHVITEDSVRKKPVSIVNQLKEDSPEFMSQFSGLCNEWDVHTLNFNNVAIAVYRLVKPDENGVTVCTFTELVNYLIMLRKVGKTRYIQNPTLHRYFFPNDSLVFIKHYSNIRRIMLQTYAPQRAKEEEQGCKYHQATIEGKAIPNKRSAMCSLEDVKAQKRGAAHPNDLLELNEFIGDDLLYERERRVKKRTGNCNLSDIVERQRYMANRIFGEEGGSS